MQAVNLIAHVLCTAVMCACRGIRSDAPSRDEMDWDDERVDRTRACTHVHTHVYSPRCLVCSLKAWKSFSSAKIKERARKGIPDGLRGRAWSMMLGANELQKAYEKKTGETGHYARYAAIV